ncbi:pseudouridine-5'-phosphate glycosidase [Alicyclobacillus sp. ALC3]|uniref:pseudouridine-5'-phosphate glycosidase n=1 Tax=Alicyclobacillus sp. ALC3 TaxID=2796143 RepID=UPI00237873A5|nr:pseudouridine-5'-phosphate glycosidase [Alicyclobacillus sp. ALC3]WDL95791.1 pseudouridine-5'-phosphate glycosidase [Alicyclobacillus sp. ALC3]
MNLQRNYLTFTDEVREALADKRPIVALETTIVTHGMPYPQNVETARLVEETIRTAGATPATIGVYKGAIHVGMSVDELEWLAEQTGVIKASRRDLPAALSLGQTASTTVAATMMAARLAGVRTFVTGGIGGVHRGAERTMDISADLTELAHTDVIVVCAGAKAILDIGLTLEVLETLGVPVLGYQTARFPAFYTRDSGYLAPTPVDSAEQVADIARVKWDLGWQGGVLVGNPIPAEHELDESSIREAIRQALAAADEQGVSGKDVTPFLLSALERETAGQSLAANIRLIEHNAKVGAEIAKAYQLKEA